MAYHRVSSILTTRISLNLEARGGDSKDKN